MRPDRNGGGAHEARKRHRERVRGWEDRVISKKEIEQLYAKTMGEAALERQGRKRKPKCECGVELSRQVGPHHKPDCHMHRT
jgi:hypothetical protein